jgi:hypothetical protein
MKRLRLISNYTTKIVSVDENTSFTAMAQEIDDFKRNARPYRLLRADVLDADNAVVLDLMR